MKRSLILSILAFSILALICLPATALEGNEDLFIRTKAIFPGEQAFRKRLSEESPDKKPLGILLSGGSARAYAHIGVLKRLEEANVKPDFIVANSMGGIVALLYATGMSPDDIENLIAKTPMSELFSPKLPFGGGIMNSYRYMDVLHDLFGDIRIEDLPIPVIIVCEDLKTKRQVWITEGDFFSVMRAAFSMPVYFDPVPLDGFMLVDGGTINLVPVDVMTSFTDRMIVATTFYRTNKVNYKNALSILNLNFSICKELAAINMIKEYDPPLIRCDVEDLSFMDYARISEIVDRGYRSADRDLERIIAQVGLNPRADPANRAELSERRKATQQRILIGAPFYHNGGRIFGKIALGFPASYGSPCHFIQDPYAAAYAVAEKGPIGVAIGPSSSLIELEPAASLALHLGPAGPFSLDSYHRYTADYRYTQATLRALFWLPYPVAWMPFAETEIKTDSSFRTENQYHRGGITFFTSSYGKVRPELTAYAFREGDAVTGIGGEASLALAPIYPLEIRARALGRYALWAPNDFNLFANDGYRGIMPDNTPLPHAIVNAEAALNADKLSFSLAETILVSRIDAALYFDMIESDTRSMAAGLALTTTASLIGLAPLTITAYGGWDITAAEPFLTLKVGSLFGKR
jgi:NTE family protein